MTNMTEMADQQRAVILMVGYPGAGKTGSLACLANAGFKLRILDFDGNLDPLFKFVEPDKRGNVDIVTCEDKLRSGPKFIEVAGLPTAFTDALNMLTQWKYTNADGEVVDLGRSKDWGRDTVVVVDSLTGMGRAAKRRAMAMQNRTPINFRRNDWGLAMSDQEAFLEILTSSRLHHHVIVTAHLKMIGPKEEEAHDTDLAKELKQRDADIVPTRLFPSALGRALPPNIGEHFPTLLLVESVVKGGKARRKIVSVPRPELDLKVPAIELPSPLDVEDGLVQVFEALTGDIQSCLTK